MILKSIFHTFSIHILVFKIFERDENVGRTTGLNSVLSLIKEYVY